MALNGLLNLSKSQFLECKVGTVITQGTSSCSNTPMQYCRECTWHRAGSQCAPNISATTVWNNYLGMYVGHFNRGSKIPLCFQMQTTKCKHQLGEIISKYCGNSKIAASKRWERKSKRTKDKKIKWSCTARSIFLGSLLISHAEIVGFFQDGKTLMGRGQVARRNGWGRTSGSLGLGHVGLLLLRGVLKNSRSTGHSGLLGAREKAALLLPDSGTLRDRFSVHSEAGRSTVCPE